MGIERRVWLPVVALLLLGSALMLPRLGASGLWDPWEPKYVQTADEMAERGDWIVPFYRDDPRLNRPPMTYWLIGMSRGLFGASEAAGRLPSAILAVLCAAALGLAFAIRGRPWEGFVCGGALLTCPQWLLLGRSATLAMPLAAMLGLLLAVAVAAPVVRSASGKRAIWVLSVLFVAGAALSNFPRGILLPAWGVLGWAAVGRRWPGVASFVAVAALYHAGQLGHSPWLNLVSYVLACVLALGWLLVSAGVPWRALLAASALVLVLAAPWFVAVSGVQGEELKIFNYKYAFNLGEGAGTHTGPYHYVLAIAAIGGLPWAAVAIAGLVAAFGRRRDEPAVTMAGALIGALGFFTLSEAQMGHFYVVLQPAVAGLAAVGTFRMLRRRDWTVIPCAAALVVIGLLVRDKPSRILETATVKSSLFGLELAAPALAALGLWAAALAGAWLLRREKWAVLGLIPAAVFAGALGVWAVPALEMKKSLKPVWERYLSERGPGEPIGMYGSSKASAYYYGGDELERIYETEELEEFLSGPGARFLIVPIGTLKKLAKSDGRWERLDRAHPSHTLARYERE